MFVLAADTATLYNSVALCEGAPPGTPAGVRVLAEKTLDPGRTHSERLIEVMDGVLDEADIPLDQVDLLAMSIGPGSFTGLRIGAATWKGLALGAGLPLIGVPTLSAMSRLVTCSSGLVCPLLDAKMQEVFGAAFHFESGVRTTALEARACSAKTFLEDLSELPSDQRTQVPPMFFGDGAERYHETILQGCPSADMLPSSLSAPRASTVAAEALDLLSQGVSTDAAAVAPVYLRRSQAEELRDQNELKTSVALGREETSPA